MKRKIIKQAGQAYTLTLPISWVRENNLSEKSEVDIEIKGKSLTVSSNSKIVGPKVEINYHDVTNRALSVQINALYARGVDEIKIISKEDISQQIIRSLNNTMGFALISQDKEGYVIKDISGSNYSDLDEILKRVYQTVIIFFDNAITDIFGLEKQTLEDLKARDLEINKFCLYLQRAINKKSYDDEINGRTMFTYSFALEKLGDEIERAWRTNVKYRVKKVSGLKEFCDQSRELFSRSFDLYYQYNPKRIDSIYKERDNLREKSMKFTKIDPITMRFIRHILKIAEDSADLNHLILMRRL